jgi:hypothetical protein
VRPQPDSLHRISVRTLVLAAAPDPFKPGVPGLTLTQTWLVLRSYLPALSASGPVPLLGVRRVSRQDSVGAYPASDAGHFTRREGRPKVYGPS